ncbi:MAG: tripartite tricarboxylate transporter TctB family protein [Alphaproteobacteria bacterium]|nr:tripartite tricarboxylate transporter TctB family protein [Alphaproteobacteria bacterium]
MRRLLNAETLSGAFVLALGGIGLLAIGNLEIGTLNDMGPGYMARAVAWAILAFGAVILLMGLRAEMPPIPAMEWRPALAISLATIAFGATIDRQGIVIATIAMTVLAGFASPITRHRETPILAAALAAGAALVFVVGLKLAIPIWPR